MTVTKSILPLKALTLGQPARCELDMQYTASRVCARQISSAGTRGLSGIGILQGPVRKVC